MNRSEYIKSLNEFLSNLPDDERAGAISYHEELFDDAGEENEANVIESLGSPREVADTILKESGMLAVSDENFSKTDSSFSNNQNYDNNQSFKNQNNCVYNNQSSEKSSSKAGTVLLMVLIIIFTSGLWMSIFGVLFGLFICVCAASLVLIMGFWIG